MAENHLRMCLGEYGTWNVFKKLVTRQKNKQARLIGKVSQCERECLRRTKPTCNDGYYGPKRKWTHSSPSDARNMWCERCDAKQYHKNRMWLQKCSTVADCNGSHSEVTISQGSVKMIGWGGFAIAEDKCEFESPHNCTTAYKHHSGNLTWY